MSYDLGLKDPVTGETLELDAPLQMEGGTYAIGVCSTAEIDITYNYSGHYKRVFGSMGNGRYCGIRCIYGMTGAESIPILEQAISMLGDDVNEDYWEPTEGNAKHALYQCLALAQLRPDGVWEGVG